MAEDLIRRSKALATLGLEYKDTVYVDKFEVAKRIKAIPSSGIIPQECEDIVHCWECERCKVEGDDEEGTHYLWCWKHGLAVEGTDHCSWGERKK